MGCRVRRLGQQRGRCVAWLLAGGAALGCSAEAQTLAPADIRTEVRGARLGAGYAQMINLSASPEWSAANYTVRSGDSGPDLSLDVYRIPYQAHWFTATPGTDVFWRASAGYLRMDQYLPLGWTAGDRSAIDSQWAAGSITAGLLARVQLGNGFTLEPAVDVGLARLTNDARYFETAVLARPLLDGVLFNWRTNAWLLTPSLGLAWSAADAGRKFSVAGHVARSWVKSFGATDPVQDFSETANIYALRARYSAPLGVVAFDRPLDWIAYAGYTGFFGANKDALGFDAVAEVGGGVEWPLAVGLGDTMRLRLTAGYLSGPNVKGWSLALSLSY